MDLSLSAPLSAPLPILPKFDNPHLPNPVGQAPHQLIVLLPGQPGALLLFLRLLRHSTDPHVFACRERRWLTTRTHD